MGQFYLNLGSVCKGVILLGLKLEKERYSKRSDEATGNIYLEKFSKQ